MCLCCLCCCSAKCCTFFAAIFTAVESLLFVSWNIVLILIYKCIIQPPEKNILEDKETFFEQAWSWFLYDKDNCIERYDSYEEPSWIIDVPLYFSKSGTADNVTAADNYGYQMTFLILHCLWFLSAFPLMVGTCRKRTCSFLPWIIIGLIIITMDTVVGSFYLKLMDDTNPGWDDGKAIFAMQFIYFRGFLIYLINIAALASVSVNFCQVYMKRRKQKKLKRKATIDVLVQTTITTAPTQPAYPGPTVTTYDYVPPNDTIPQVYDRVDESNYSRRPPAPTRYRPFSYTNPAYRPADSHDIEGMKTNAPVILPSKGYDNPPLYSAQDFTHTQGSSYEHSIPRASLQKK